MIYFAFSLWVIYHSVVSGILGKFDLSSHLYDVSFCIVIRFSTHGAWLNFQLLLVLRMLILLHLSIQISRPEDWDKVPDPKKYFVQFFGTKEM